ncbi:hypothetical protein Mnod_0920 [Methylobacterium nodulans ORS 2060]|uniref:Uncharacterized protein n=1 Tax=Methylobacterium nodulans (strain LMG 21967 / CNCM I-2342 / ORS 2060) TaxID=460265 RepID=B8IGN9_METNO|nr:hypothetical protein Mnod_0920 [Methylobacterium nodulans ORS 2060]
MAEEDLVARIIQLAQQPRQRFYELALSLHELH